MRIHECCMRDLKDPEGRGQLKRYLTSKKGEKTARTGELIVTVDGWTDGKGTVGQRSQ